MPIAVALLFAGIIAGAAYSAIALGLFILVAAIGLSIAYPVLAVPIGAAVGFAGWWLYREWRAIFG